MKKIYVEKDWAEGSFAWGELRFEHKKGKKADWAEGSWPPVTLYILTEEEYNTWSVQRGHNAFRKSETDFWKKNKC